MAYTNAWLNTIPLGGASASTIDDALRQLRLDINERLLTILTSGFDDDPWELDVSGIGAQDGVNIYFSHQLCHGHEDDDDLYWYDDYFESDDNQDYPVYMPIALPAGATLTDFDIVMDIHNSSQVSVDLRRVLFAGGTSSTSVSSQNITATGVIVHAIIDGASHTVGDGAYYLKLNNATGSGQYRVYGARATINVSGLSQYI